MRMICPNCSAQYEVDKSVIPDGGRDVQCSNCGHTWFQSHEDQENEPSAEVATAAPEAAPVTETDAASDTAPDAAPEPQEVTHETSAEAVQEPEAAASEPDEAADASDETTKLDATAEETPSEATDAEVPSDAAPAEPDSVPDQQGLDAGVANILREEAEREAAERSATGGGLEMQPELGLQDAAGETSANVQERLARLRGQDDAAAATAAAASPGSSKRRDLLPDIEEINSTLSASSQSRTKVEEIEQEKRRRSSFRLGFALTVLLFAAMALVYVYSPKIVEAVPKSESYLAAYVDWINALRVSVDAIMQRAVDNLTGLLSRIGGGPPE